MTHPALARILEHVRPQPDLISAQPDLDDRPAWRPSPRYFGAGVTFGRRTPACTCPALDGHTQNPTCPAHPWWKRDPAVLDLADHPDGPWAAAIKAFGGGSA